MARVRENEEHYCKKHRSTYGYIDPDGVWHCWACYKEDSYRCPQGVIRDTYTVNNYEARIMFVGPHNVRIEIWYIKGNTYRQVWHNNYGYLSVAGREWVNLTARMDKGERF